jgi:hypothetical protein
MTRFLLDTGSAGDTINRRRAWSAGGPRRATRPLSPGDAKAMTVFADAFAERAATHGPARCVVFPSSSFNGAHCRVR